MKRMIQWFVMIHFAALLAACGGSGDGDRTQAPAETGLLWSEGNWDQQEWR